MPLLSTPSSTPRAVLPYYEDVYGHRNEDEEFDRFANDCEDETDSDRDEGALSCPPSSAERGFFKQYSASRNIFTAADCLKQLTPTTPKSKKLTPRKYGLFGTPGSATQAATMDDAAQDPLAGMLMSGGLNDLDDRFYTLDEKASPSRDMAPSSQEQIPECNVAESELVRDKMSSTTEANFSGEDDGYQADADELPAETEVHTPKKRYRTATEAREAEGPGVKSLPTTARYKTRGERRKEEKEKEAERLAKRRKTRSMSSPVDKVKQNPRKKKVTARSATMRKTKTRKSVRTPGPGDVVKRRPGRGRGKRREYGNGNGQKRDREMTTAQAKVVVEDGDVDLEEFEEFGSEGLE